jgi:hypothetical protein
MQHYSTSLITLYNLENFRADHSDVYKTAVSSLFAGKSKTLQSRDGFAGFLVWQVGF